MWCILKGKPSFSWCLPLVLRLLFWSRGFIAGLLQTKVMSIFFAGIAFKAFRLAIFSVHFWQCCVKRCHLFQITMALSFANFRMQSRSFFSSGKKVLVRVLGEVFKIFTKTHTKWRSLLERSKVFRIGETFPSNFAH